MRANRRRRNAKAFRKRINQILEDCALHTRRTVTADFFLIRKHDHNRLIRVFRVEKRGVCRVGAYSVIVAVCRNQAPVKAKITRLEGRNQGEFRTQEIRFNHAVLRIQNLQKVFLYRVLLVLFFFRLEGNVAKPNVQIFATQAFAKGFCVLLCRQVGKQVTDIEDRVFIVFTDGNVQHFAVLLDDRTVQCKGDCRPLIFTDTAIVMRFCKRNTVCFVQGDLLQVDSRAVDVRSQDADTTLADVFAAYANQVQIFTPVVIVHLVAYVQFHAEFVGNVACRNGCLFRISASFSFGFTSIQECCISFCIIEDCLHFCFVSNFVNVRSLIGKFAHIYFSFGIVFSVYD